MKIVEPSATRGPSSFLGRLKSCPVCSEVLEGNVRGLVFDRGVFGNWPEIWVHGRCVDRYTLIAMRNVLTHDDMATGGG